MAARKSAAELKEEGAALGQQIAIARKKPVNFALLMGKDSLVLETDIRKGPDILWRMAKKVSGGSKGARGQMTVNGKVITLTCPDDEAPAHLPKLAVKFFRERGQPYKVVMVTPSGEFSDGEDDGAEADPEAAVGAATPDGAGEGLASPVAEDEEEAMRAELRAMLDEMADQIAAAERSQHAGAARKVETLRATIEAAIEASPGKAASMVRLLKKAVSDALAFGTHPAEGVDVPAQSVVEPEEAARAERRSKRMQDLEALKQKIEALLSEIATA